MPSTIYLILSEVGGHKMHVQSNPPPSHRHLWPDGEALHDAALAGIVVDGEMLGAAIVPYRQRARRPADAAGEFGTHRMLGEEIDERQALGLAHVAEADGVAAVDVERLAAGRRMGAE